MPDRSTSHIEVDGTAEAVDDEYVPNIRKSRYVSDDSAAPIEIRTTAPISDRAKLTQPPAEADAEPAKDETRSSEPVPPPPRASRIEVSDVTDVDAQPQSTPWREDSRSVLPETSAAAAASAAMSGMQKDKPARPSVYDTKPPIEEARKNYEGGSEKSQDRRILGIGFIVLAMIAVAVYGVYFFSFRDDPQESAIDSTAIKASIEAGRFIDSTQTALTDIELAPDTIPLAKGVPPEPVETKPKVYARDDSLVLEAFTNAPVWFSVKMDTLRTERGSLSSNEHRIWKAREYFVITLGDAGAVTFFLNGKEIGTLGDEGSVVKNVVLSRSRTKGD